MTPPARARNAGAYDEMRRLMRADFFWTGLIIFSVIHEQIAAGTAPITPHLGWYMSSGMSGNT